MEKESKISRPGTLAEVARRSRNLTEFGYNLRDWQHEVRDKWRGKADFARRIAVEPELLQDTFPEGDVADAYLAAYALWLADEVGLPRVQWALSECRQSREPWFSGHKRASLLRDSPAHFIERDLFTIPDASFLNRRLSQRKTKTEDTVTIQVRRKNGLTQAALASLLGVGLGTIRNWEQGRHKPGGAAKTLLEVLNRHPEVVGELHKP